MRVVAVVETALAAIGGEFDEAFLDVAETQVMQAEGLHAGAINQMAGRVQVVQARVGGGVFS